MEPIGACVTQQPPSRCTATQARSRVRTRLLLATVLAIAGVTMLPSAAVAVELEETHNVLKATSGAPINASASLGEERNAFCAFFSPTPCANGPANVNWGDGTSSETFLDQVTGCAVVEKQCSFSIFGEHTYKAIGAHEGYFDLKQGSFVESVHVPFTFNVYPAQVEIKSTQFHVEGHKATLSAVEARMRTGVEDCANAHIDWGDGREEPLVFAVPTVRTGSQPASSEEGSCQPIFPASHTYEEGQPHQAPRITVEAGSSLENGAKDEASVSIPNIVPVSVELPAGFESGIPGTTETTTKLLGIVKGEGSPITDCHFEWGETNVAFPGHLAAQHPCEPNGEGAICPQKGGPPCTHDVMVNVAGLNPGKKYYFRLVASTAAGTGYAPGYFETTVPPVPGAPTAITGAPGSPSKTSETVSGDVNPNGGTLASCQFEWGTDTSYGHAAPCTPAPPQTGTQPIGVSAKLEGLTPGVTYHFRITAANNGSPVSRGADVSFTTLPSCETEVTFGYADAKGCLLAHGANYVTAPGSQLTVNGLTLTPDEGRTTITIEPGALKISSSGTVKVTASEVSLYDGVISWTEPKPDGVDPVSVATLKPPAGASVGGLQFEGSLALSFNAKKGTDLASNVSLPFGEIAKLLKINGTVTLHTGLGVGLEHDLITVKKELLELGGVQIRNLKAVYSPTDDLWGGGAEVVLPTPNKITVGAELELEHGNFHKFAGSVGNINVPLVYGVYLQRIAVVFGVEPTTFGGGLGMSFGPEVSGKALVGVNGNFLYQAPFGQEPGHFHIDGELTLIGVKTESGYFDYFTSGLVRFGFALELGLPNPLAEKPKKQPVYIEGSLAGALYESKFDVLAKANLHLNFISVELGGEVLVSDKGLAGCAHVWFVEGGFGYTWATHSLSLMGPSCSVGQWETLQLGAVAKAATGSKGVVLPGNGALIEVKGASDAPKVRLDGPLGQSVSVPVTSVAPYKAGGFVVLQDPADHVTYIGVQHSRGAWRMTLEPGSASVTSIRVAPLLPKPIVTARLTGRGRARSLSWRAAPLPGQSLVFWEKGHGVDRIIGSTSGASGHLNFISANAVGGKRTILVQVLSYGLPRSESAVSHYVAPAMSRPGRPGHVKVVGIKGAVRITWVPASLAARYTVVVHTGDGAHLVEFTKGATTSLAVHDVVPITSATVTVTGRLSDGLAGPSATGKLLASTPPKKRSQHRH